MVKWVYFHEGRFQCPLHCQQCDHVMVNGNRCRRRVCIGSPTCWQHSMTRYGIRVRESGIAGAGKGLFAVKEFRRFDWICPYIGDFVTEECLDARYGVDGVAPYATSTEEGGAIDSACNRGIASLANGLFTNRGNSRGRGFHNAEIAYNQDQIWLRARRTILVGEEIFVFYGNQYSLENNHVTRKAREMDSRPC